MNENKKVLGFCLPGLGNAIFRTGFWRIGTLAFGLVTFGGSASGQTVWMGAADGAWSNAVAWTAGVPNFNPAFITNTAGSYAVSVGTDVAGTFSDLTLANAGINTTRLEIAGGSLLGSNGVVNIKAGSALVLKAGGTFKYGSTNRASDFATLATNGVLRIEDGLFQVGDSNRLTRTESRYLSVSPGGLLEMTNGVANLYSGNVGGLNVNGGLFRMSGGTMTLANTNDAGDASFASFRLVNAGTVRLDGTAKLVTSNAFYLDSLQNTTSRLEIASENAAFTFISVLSSGRPFMSASGYSALDVRKGRLIVGTSTDFTEANFYPNSIGGTVAVNVWEGGYAAFKQIVMARDKSSGMAQVNVYGGTFAMPGSGCISVGRDSFKVGVIAQVNVTNGVFDMTDTSKTWVNAGAPAIAVGWNYNGGARTPWGQISLSGGAISNAGGFALGLNKATRGDFNQSGGIFRQGFGNQNLATNNATGQFVAGFSGGTGNCTLSNGLFEAVRDVYVGGVDALARWGMTKIYASPGYGNTNVAPGSVGTFSLAGGSVVISNTVVGKTATLHVGDFGTGTVSVAESGALYAQAVELHAAPDGSRASTLRFTFGAQGVGKITCGSLNIGGGAKLVVNADAYSASVPAFCLIAFGSKTGDFAAGDVTITGTRKWELRTTATGIWLRRDSGTLLRVN